MRQSYRTDLSDEQRELLEKLMPTAKTGGRPGSVEIAEVINAIFYLVSGAMAWHLLPHDFPKWTGGVSLLAQIAPVKVTGFGFMMCYAKG